MPVNIAFYTDGDERIVYRSTSGPSITQSAAYQWYAERHSATGRARTARTIHEAITMLRSLGDQTVGVVHFVGHGAGNYGDFVLIGGVEANNTFSRQTPLTQYPFNLLQAPKHSDFNQMFVDELARVVVRSGARVEMQFCWSARGQLQKAIATTFRARGVTNFQIRATRSFFDFRVQAVSNAGNYRIRNVIGASLPVVMR